MATVCTSDGVVFNLEPKLIKSCKTIRDCTEECNDGVVMPIPNVNSVVFNKIIHYNTTGELGLDSACDLLPLLCACDYLQYDELLDHGAKLVAESLRGKTPAEVRSYFNL